MQIIVDFKILADQSGTAVRLVNGDKLRTEQARSERSVHQHPVLRAAVLRNQLRIGNIAVHDALHHRRTGQTRRHFVSGSTDDILRIDETVILHGDSLILFSEFREFRFAVRQPCVDIGFLGFFLLCIPVEGIGVAVQKRIEFRAARLRIDKEIRSMHNPVGMHGQMERRFVALGCKCSASIPAERLTEVMILVKLLVGSIRSRRLRYLEFVAVFPDIRIGVGSALQSGVVNLGLVFVRTVIFRLHIAYNVTLYMRCAVCLQESHALCKARRNPVRRGDIVPHLRSGGGQPAD